MNFSPNGLCPGMVGWCGTGWDGEGPSGGNLLNRDELKCIPEAKAHDILDVINMDIFKEENAFRPCFLVR